MQIILQGNNEGSQLAVKMNGIAIIVDVLRASTTIPITMEKGIKEFYISKEVDDARYIAKQYNTLLMGERDCIPQEGFDYGNSPVEMLHLKNLLKKKASFTSSTGAKRVIEAIGSKFLLIGSLVNAKYVAHKVIKLVEKGKQIKNPIVIIPAFSSGSIIKNEITEDQIGGILIAQEFMKLGCEISEDVKNEITYLNKIRLKKTLNQLFLETSHGKKLLSLGFEEDINLSSKLNICKIVPISKNDVLLEHGKIFAVRFQK